MQSVDGGVKIVRNIHKSESLDNFYDISHKFQYLSSVFCSSSEAMVDFEGIFLPHCVVQIHIPMREYLF